MTDYLKEILEFCDKYKKITCYGAGNYGYTIKHFLDEHEIKIEFFIVTNIDGIASGKTVEGIPIISIDSAPKNLEDYGVIISLSEKFHSDVVKVINEKYTSKLPIYYITSQIWYVIYSYLLNNRREKILFLFPYNISKKDSYEKRAKKIEKKYNQIYI